MDSFKTLGNNGFDALKIWTSEFYNLKFYFAAQSLDDPDPYSYPARMIVYYPSF